jgi:hypothetical protein
MYNVCTLYTPVYVRMYVYIVDVGNACASGVKCVEPSQYIYSGSVGGPGVPGPFYAPTKPHIKCLGPPPPPPLPPGPQRRPAGESIITEKWCPCSVQEVGKSGQVFQTFLT